MPCGGVEWVVLFVFVWLFIKISEWDSNKRQK